MADAERRFALTPHEAVTVQDWYYTAGDDFVPDEADRDLVARLGNFVHAHEADAQIFVYIPLTIPERAFLTDLIAQHNLDTPPGHDTHRLLLRKLKLTAEEWQYTDERIY